jgi:pimeloyl-ACP methyl ester carboxylesterase
MKRLRNAHGVQRLLWACVLTALPVLTLAADQPVAPATAYKTVKVGELDIFYREAGPKDAPAVLLLHGYPTSSFMYRNLIPHLAQKYRIIAPDYPGFGHSSAPAVGQFTYTFDNLANVIDAFTEKVGLQRFAMYVQDYGAPIGYRIAVKHPERISALIVQNGNAYEEGLDNEFWKPIKTYWKEPTVKNAEPLRAFVKLEGTRWQYTHGARNPENLAPDTWTLDQSLLDRPGNVDIQVALFYDYRTNPQQYPTWHEYFRKHQPPTLLVWGKNDACFPPAGAEPYKRDLKNIEFHLLDTGHFALEEDVETIAKLMNAFLAKNMAK